MKNKCPYCDRHLRQGYCAEYSKDFIAHTYTVSDNNKEIILFTNNSKPLRFNNFCEINSFDYRQGYRRVEDFSIFKNKTFEQIALLYGKLTVFE